MKWGRHRGLTKYFSCHSFQTTKCENLNWAPNESGARYGDVRDSSAVTLCHIADCTTE